MTKGTTPKGSAQSVTFYVAYHRRGTKKKKPGVMHVRAVSKENAKNKARKKLGKGWTIDGVR